MKHAIQIFTYISKALGSNLGMHCKQVRWQCFSGGYESGGKGVEAREWKIRESCEGQDGLLPRGQAGTWDEERITREGSEGLLEYILRVIGNE